MVTRMCNNMHRNAPGPLGWNMTCGEHPKEKLVTKVYFGSYVTHAALLVQIGGVRAPSPVGELGNVEMTQSLNIIEPQWQGSGPDMLLTGYLPASGGLEALDAALSGQPPLSSQPAAHQSNGSAQPGLNSNPPLSRVEARRRSSPDTNKVG